MSEFKDHTFMLNRGEIEFREGRRQRLKRVRKKGKEEDNKQKAETTEHLTERDRTGKMNDSEAENIAESDTT